MKIQKKSSVLRPVFSEVVDTLLVMGCRAAIKFVSPKLVVKATRRHRPDRRTSHTEILVSFGRPNCAERRFVRELQKAGEPFPVKKVRLIAWPLTRQT